MAPPPAPGLFVGPHYRWDPVRPFEMDVATLFFGLCVGMALYTAANAAALTFRCWRRRRRHGERRRRLLSGYIAMIWGHWASNMAIAPLTWLHLKRVIPAGFWLYFFIGTSVQLLMQIIVNRVSLLIAVPSVKLRLKWVTLLVIGLINVSVFIIWIPAQLQASERWMHINHIWDRIEKVIFLVIDASLNCCFIYQVRTRLIANGLTKYTTLFRVNLAMIFFSVSLDVMLVGLMSMPNHIVYLQFQCAAYMAKLQIEINMADLIRKVVKASNRMNGPDDDDTDGMHGTSSGGHHGSHHHHHPSSKRFIATLSRGANHTDDDDDGDDIGSHVAHVEGGAGAVAVDLAALEPTPSALAAVVPPPTGIKKTTRTVVSQRPKGLNSTPSSHGLFSGKANMPRRVYQGDPE
ncbi:hypothetical protein GGR56DRAFT_693685 [Xylariaceae sp. FL0804]|nr:hypothetical protein GGR56DRAFT_693685 [Xylariaceae sp. FL0804]